MKLFRGATALFLLALFAVQVGAGMITNSFNVGNRPHVVFQGCANDDTDLTTYQYLTQPLGAELENRTIIMVIGGRDGAGAFGIASGDIGGVGFTIDRQDATQTVGAASAIVHAAVPTGTTGTVNVTWTEAVLGSSICIFAAYNLNSATPTDTAWDEDGSGDTTVLETDVQSYGIIVGGAHVNDTGTPTMTWTGLTERADDNAGEVGYSAADYTAGNADETNRSIDAIWATANGSTAVTGAYR